MKQITKKIVGVIFIIVGFLALVTPFSPGSWLILVGLEFLGLRILLADKLLAWARRKPRSLPARMVCRMMCVWERDPAAKGRWRRLRERMKSLRRRQGERKVVR
ncbi:MAG: hypothetical protein A2Y77_05505 [Planctomycetes bacterium RBG_13_62_9]|nr:MAG: hypothetical protein A2Y77_05505 [Planctomycetes bacterium RBG_13_62_9]